MNCNVSNGIYIVECEGCIDQYGGSTMQKFRTRQNGHRWNIIHKEIHKCEMYRHFNRDPCIGPAVYYSNNDMLSNMNALHYYTWTPVEMIQLVGYSENDKIYNEYKLNMKEREWQAKLGTIHSGLNGTSDWYNTNDTRRMKNIMDRIPQMLATIYRNNNHFH